MRIAERRCQNQRSLRTENQGIEDDKTETMRDQMLKLANAI